MSKLAPFDAADYLDSEEMKADGVSLNMLAVSLLAENICTLGRA
jgi:hypothetical protein